MSEWLASLLGRRPPAPPLGVLRRFAPSEPPLSQDAAIPADRGWMVEGPQSEAIRLFEVSDLNVDRCTLIYRASLRTEGLQGRAFLEMWVRIPGKGEFFSKGLRQPVKGTTDWVSCETPFRLKKGQIADLVKLNLVVEGTGQVGIKDVELLRGPL